MSKIYYVTKYALTSKDGTPMKLACEPFGDGYLSEVGGNGWTLFKLGRDAFETLADAKADVERRRLEKITSLRKQIAKLEKLAAPASSEKEG